MRITVTVRGSYRISILESTEKLSMVRMNEWVHTYCHAILNFGISALVSFSVAMIQSSDRSNLREKGFISRFSLP